MMKMVHHKKQAFLLFLAFSLLLSSATSRSLNLIQDGTSLQDFLAQGAMEMKEERVERIDIESNDYPGTGANNHHDPKSPGRP